MNFVYLDLLFPFFVFGYGLIVTVITHHQGIIQMAEQKLPLTLSQQLKLHRPLALICLLVGAVWSLQNIWYMQL